MTRRASHHPAAGVRAGLGIAAALVACLATNATVASQQRVFRGIGSLVTVDVAVYDGPRLLRGLTAADFEIDDNGVPQQPEMLDVESLPIDLTLIADTSGSVITMVDEIRDYVRLSAEVLRVDDRVRLITFSGEVRDVFGLQPATEPLPVEVLGADGATSIYDAIMAGLMRTRRADRRQILVCITDGIETNSAMSVSSLLEVARRSDSVVDVFVIRDRMGNPQPNYYQDTRGYWLSRLEFDTKGLGDVARETGGWLQEIAVRPQLPTRLREALEDFRSTYVVRYQPRGVEQRGWHAISVRVPKARGARVLARTGYFWD